MLSIEEIVREYSHGFDLVGKIFSRFVKGIFDINSDSYVSEGIPFLRILNLKNGIIQTNNIAYITEKIHQIESKTALKRGQIVLSKTAYPAASLVTLDECNASQDTVATTLSDYGAKNFLPEVLVSYFNCKYGNELLLRQFQGNIQLHLGLEDGRKIPVPRLGQAYSVKSKAVLILR